MALPIRPGDAVRPLVSAVAQLDADPAAAVPGQDRQTAVPLGETAEAGGVLLRVVEVVAGQAATDAVVAADPSNAAPREGVAYLLVRLEVENRGERPLALSNDDFAVVGASGLVRRFLWLTPPAPALPAAVAPGETEQGWVVLSAPVDEGGLVLLYDNLSLAGAWADRYLALEADAAPPIPAAPAPPANAVGADPVAAAGIGEVVSAAGWEVELLEVAEGAAVFALVDYRTGALTVEDAIGADPDGSVWLALHFRIASVASGGGAATLPANAFALVDPAGAPLLDLATLTPPSPDAAGDYFPGASRDGWVAFDVPVARGPVLVRFQPFPETAADPDPRYFRPG